MKQSNFYNLEENTNVQHFNTDYNHNILSTQSIHSDNLSIYQQRFIDNDSISILAEDSSRHSKTNRLENKEKNINQYSLTASEGSWV